jgi:hypothetical protein
MTRACVLCLLMSLSACVNPDSGKGRADGGSTCRAGTTRCGDACVDLRLDDAHCGACGVTCSPSEACAGSRCLPRTCDTAACSESQVCVDSVACRSRLCVGVVCPAGQSCRDGRCEVEACGSTACPAGNLCVDGACADISCVGVTCPSGKSCQQGACLGPSGCDAGVLNDASNCGRCGNACPGRASARATCTAGACGFVCDDGFADCDGQATTGCEANLLSPSTCGSCTNVCSSAPLSDRTCAAGVCGLVCQSGYFSITPGEPCRPWSTCAAPLTLATATRDRLCPGYLHQFGTADLDQASGVAIDADGGLVVVGFTRGTLPGQSSAGENDAFVRRYDARGAVLWTRQFGSSSPDLAASVAVDAAGNALVVGQVGERLPGQVSAGADDAFVAKFDPSGGLLWVRQFGTVAYDTCTSVAVGAQGQVLVAGRTEGSLVTGQPGAGNTRDGFVRAYDADGALLWTRQFGVGTEEDAAEAVAVGPSGSSVTVGSTKGALGGPGSHAGLFDVFLRKHDAAGAVLWTRQLGTIGNDTASSVAMDALENVFVTGTTSGALSGQTAGGLDVFVAKYNAAGTLLWIRQFDSSGGVSDVGHSVAVDVAGNALVAGYTGGAFAGEISLGAAVDAFVRKYDADGGIVWTRPFGSASDDYATSVAVNATGAIAVAGYTRGALPGQVSVGVDDAFVATLPP